MCMEQLQLEMKVAQLHERAIGNMMMHAPRQAAPGHNRRGQAQASKY